MDSYQSMTDVAFGYLIMGCQERLEKFRLVTMMDSMREDLQRRVLDFLVGHQGLLHDSYNGVKEIARRIVNDLFEYFQINLQHLLCSEPEVLPA